MNEIITKICYKCLVEKPLSDFGAQKERPDKTHSWCKKCLSEARRKRYRKFPEKEIAYALEWQKANKEHVKVVTREYKQKNKEKLAKQQRLWIKNNPEKVKEHKRNDRIVHKDYYKEYNAKYYSENKDKHRENGKKWYWNNIEKARLIGRIIAHRRRAKLNGRFTPKEWLELCDKYGNKCLCCNDVCKLTQDHIVPVSRGGSNTIENIQPLCITCNFKKGTKTIDYRPKE